MRSKPEQRTTRLVTVTARKLRQTNSSPIVHPFLVHASSIGLAAPTPHRSRKQNLCCCFIATSQIKMGLGLCFQWITPRQILTSQIHIAAALRFGPRPDSATQPLPLCVATAYVLNVQRGAVSTLGAKVRPSYISRA